MALSAGMPLLLIGDTGSAVAALQAWLPQPIIASLGGQPLALPIPGWTGTVLIHEVDRCAAAEQQHLLQWLGARGRVVQVVSTTTVSLLSRVEAGEFREDLYYRLNLVCIDVTLAFALPAAEPFWAEPVGAMWFEWPPRI